MRNVTLDFQFFQTSFFAPECTQWLVTVLMAVSIFFASSESAVSKNGNISKLFFFETIRQKVGRGAWLFRIRRTTPRFLHFRYFPPVMICVTVIVMPLSSSSGSLVVFPVF